MFEDTTLFSKMVDTTKFRVNLPRIFVLQALCCMSLSSVLTSVQAKDVNVQFCWNGTEEELSSWRNMSCATGSSSLANSLSTKILSSDQEDGISARSVTGYSCMAFKYFDNSMTHDGGEDTTVQTTKAIYTCDVDNICEGKNQMEGYNYTYKGHEGLLYCCSSGNLCNKHGIIQSQKHRHSCYSAHVDFTSTSTYKAQVEDCPSENTLCLLTQVKGLYANGTVQHISETYKCDTEQVCRDENLLEARDHACARREPPSLPEGQHEDVCCCRGDRCFVPHWLGEPPTNTVLTDPMQAQTTWQRTVLIIIGVALGILVVSITLFFVRRSIVATKHNESPTRNTHMAYLSVSSNNDDAVFDDNVKMLSSYK